MVSKTVHFTYGCPWADGSIQLADTFQTCDWRQVTCKHCLNNRKYNYGGRRRAKYGWNKDGTKPLPEQIQFYHPFCYMDKEELNKEIKRLCDKDDVEAYLRREGK